MDASIVVLGGGPGGYAAAFMAADLGLPVTLVEQEPQLGGVCLLRGCIPSKALLHATELIEHARESGQWGLSFEPPQVDVRQLRSRTQKVINTLTGGLAQLARQRKVQVIRARGIFENSRTLRLGGPTAPEAVLQFEHCILATGSRPTIPEALSLDVPGMLDSTSALELAQVPPRLLVIGGGYIGLEMGTVYARLGSQVTVCELTANLLPGVDRDLVRPLQKRLESLFAKIHVNASVSTIRPAGAAFEVTFLSRPTSGAATAQAESVWTEPFDSVLVSVGRRPNSDSIGLENTSVRVDERGFVQVDGARRTHDDHIFAVGDVAGGYMLAHKAFHEGRVAAEVLAGQTAAFAPRAIPAVVYTDPEIAYAGLMEEEARAQGRQVQVVRYPWAASGRATSIGRTEGLTKLVVDAQGDRVIGVGIVGAGAGEMIAEGTLAIEMGSSAQDLAMTIHPHPTLSETVGAAAEAYLGTATEIYRPRKKS